MEQKLTFDQLLSILTEQQLSAYLMWQEALPFSRIGAELGISEERARRKVWDARERIEEYTAYLTSLEANHIAVAFPLTRGELEEVLEGLYLLERDLTRSAGKRAGRDWRKCVQDRLALVSALIERAESIVRAEFELPE